MKFFQVYFDINCGYCCGNPAEDRSDECLLELERTFRDAGWEITVPRTKGRCPEVRLGKSSLYCHPTQLSGPVKESLIPAVEAILKQGKSYRYAATRKCHELHDVEDDGLPRFLEENRGDLLDKRIRDIANTGDRDRYVLVPDVIDTLSREFDVQTIRRPYVGVPSTAATLFVRQHVERLVGEGVLVTGDFHGTACIRMSMDGDSPGLFSSPCPTP